FHLGTTDVFTIFQYKFSIRKIRTERFEFLCIQHVVMHDINIDVQGNRVVLISQTKRYKLVCSSSFFIQYTVHKVRATLNHTLVDQFFEWLFLIVESQIFQKFIPKS